MNNGDILAGSGSNVVVGKDNEVEDNSQTAGGDLIADNDAPVLNDVDTSGGNGGGAAGGGSLIGIGGGNAAGGDGGSGGGIIITDNDVNAGTQIDGDYGSDNVEDNSVNTSVQTETSTSTESSLEDNSTNFESNIGSGNETAIGSGNETNTDLFSDNQHRLRDQHRDRHRHRVQQHRGRGRVLIRHDRQLRSWRGPQWSPPVRAPTVGTPAPHERGHHDATERPPQVRRQEGDRRADRPHQQDRRHQGARRPGRTARAGQGGASPTRRSGW